MHKKVRDLATQYGPVLSFKFGIYILINLYIYI